MIVSLPNWWVALHWNDINPRFQVLYGRVFVTQEIQLLANWPNCVIQAMFMSGYNHCDKIENPATGLRGLCLVTWYSLRSLGNLSALFVFDKIKTEFIYFQLEPGGGRWLPRQQWDDGILEGCKNNLHNWEDQVAPWKLNRNYWIIVY